MIEKRRLIPNSTQLPNIVVDELMAGMTGNELKVYLVIIRKTVGWHKSEDQISISQIVTLTGIKDNRSIKRILGSLKTKGLIVKMYSMGQPTTFSALYKGVDENEGGENVGGGKECGEPVGENEGSTPYIQYPPQNKRKQTKQNKERFLEFYAEYPNKKAKANAEKAFLKLAMTDELFSQIMCALKIQKRSDSWTKNNGQFIPMPATWINGQRWEDDLETKKGGVNW